MTGAPRISGSPGKSVTRRSLLRAGAGLAAIIAAGKAPAAFIKSMLAARNALRSGGGGGADLPYARQVEYLESTGTQYVNTGICPDNNTTTELEFMLTGNIASYDCLAGCFSNPPYRRYVICTRSSSRSRYKKGSSSSPAYEYQETRRLNVKTHILFNGTGNSLEINGVNVATLNDLDSATDLPLILFASYLYTGNVVDWSKARIYWLKMRDRSTGVLLRDYEPVIDFDGVACMYDKVSGNLFHNAGTEVFLTDEDAT